MKNGAEQPLDTGGALRVAITKAQGTTWKPAVQDHVENVLRNSPIFPQRVPNHVYHYTNITGLTGILRSQRLWASDLSYMNDTSEFVYADLAVNESLLRIVNDANLAADLASTLTIPRRQAYAACFCEEENLLSQWRTYAMAGGTGYAIEFEWRANACPLGSRTFVLGRIEYEKDRQHELFQLIAGSFVKPLLEGARKLDTLVKGGALAEDLAEEARRSYLEPFWGWQLAETLARCFTKDSIFKEEKEWRIAALAHDDPDAPEDFEPSNGILVPHLSIDLKDPAMPKIKRIFVGPSPHPDLAHKSLERFLKKYKLDQIGIESKRIPLRV